MIILIFLVLSFVDFSKNQDTHPEDHLHHNLKLKFFKGSKFGGKLGFANWGQKGGGFLSTNWPPPRRRHAQFQSKYEQNFFIFGGLTIDFESLFDNIDSNDLWEFGYMNRQWKWVTGERFGEVDGKYGSYFSENFYPGSRTDCGMVEVDEKTIFVFGGYCRNSEGNKRLCQDLWEFSLDNFQWRWISGDKIGDTYGVYSNVYDQGNIISARSGFNMLYRKKTNELVVIGGYGKDDGTSTGSGRLSDVWYMNVSNLHWRWAAGEKEHDFNSLGNRGVPTYPFTEPEIDYYYGNPGSKSNAMVYMDQKETYFLIFAGDGRDNGMKIGPMNDLWKYNFTRELDGDIPWNFLGGSKYENALGIYGERGVKNNNNWPGARYYPSTFTHFFQDDKKLLMLGGFGYDRDGTGDHYYGAFLNDIWLLDLNTFQFTWFSGSEIANSLGVFDEEYTENAVISARSEASLYLFGKEIVIYGGNGCNVDNCDNYILNDMFFGRLTYTCFDNYVEDDIECCSKHGNCINYDDVCECDDNYYGNKCQINRCDMFLSNDSSNVCSGNGFCYDYNLCNCSHPFTSGYCEISLCNNVQSIHPKVCKGRGRCLEGLCHCQTGYFGVDCEFDSLFIREFYKSWFVYSIILPLIFISLCIMTFVCIGILSRIFIKYRKTAKQFDRLVDKDILLEEKKIEKEQEKFNITKLKLKSKFFNISYDDLKIKKILGEGGSNSIVFLATWCDNTVAFKQFRSTFLFQNEVDFQEWERECEVMSTLSHPHIVRWYGVCTKPPRIGIVTEYCPNGDLRQYFDKMIQNKQSIGIKMKLRFLKEISSAICHCHSLNIIHRDLKPENIFIDGNIRIKLADFGTSRFINKGIDVKYLTKRVGTRFFMSPQVYLGLSYSGKCDVFSLGILIYSVITENFVPYPITELAIETKVSTNPNFRPDVENHLDSFKECKFLKKLMISCWQHEESSRPDIKEILKVIEENFSPSASVNDDRTSNKPPVPVKSERRRGKKKNYKSLYFENVEKIRMMKQKIKEIKEDSVSNFSETLSFTMLH